jgi:hypothetical protein
LRSPENAPDGTQQTANFTLLNHIIEHASSRNTERGYSIEKRACLVNFTLKIVYASAEGVFLSFIDLQRIYSRSHLLQIVSQLLLCCLIKTNRVALSPTAC